MQSGLAVSECPSSGSARADGVAILVRHRVWAHESVSVDIRHVGEVLGFMMWVAGASEGEDMRVEVCGGLVVGGAQVKGKGLH